MVERSEDLIGSRRGVTTGGAVVLWDVDGTLLTAGQAPKEALRQAVRSTVGTPVELGDVQMGGLTDRRIVVEILESLGAPSDTGAVSAVLDAYVVRLRSGREDLLREVQVEPGVRNVLHGLADRGVRQLVVTGNARACAELKLDAAGLAGFFNLSEGGFGTACWIRRTLPPVSLQPSRMPPRCGWSVTHLATCNAHARWESVASSSLPVDTTWRP